MHARFSRASDLAAPIAAVLPTLTLRGVNSELWPWVRMTAPEAWAARPLSEWPEKTPLFASWLLLFGVLPIDRHAFYLAAVLPGEGFVETSSSFINAQWNHTRTIATIAGGCRVTDAVHYESRLAVLGYLLQPVYQFVFWWRHRRLRARFGGQGAA